jgi:hypothetical protein
VGHRSDLHELEAYRRRAALSVEDLWLRYFGLGGLATFNEVCAHLRGAGLDDHEHDVLVHALNERFLELGLDSRIPYSRP